MKASLFVTRFATKCVAPAALLLALVAAPIVNAADTLPPAKSLKVPELKYEKFVMPNGLLVLMHEDHHLPLVAVDLWYHVGPLNERAGRTGFAHLFEHMMFEGSANIGKGEHFRLIAERGGGLTRDERFDLLGGLSIGRSKDADIQIEDRYASSIHARLFSREGRHFVEDMKSTNGTLLNGGALHGEAELVDGDTIQIGDTVFRFEAS